MWSRIYLIPMLQAEEDRDLVRRQWADKAREMELMGKETKVYHTDRLVWGFLSLWRFTSYNGEVGGAVQEMKSIGDYDGTVSAFDADTFYFADSYDLRIRSRLRESQNKIALVEKIIGVMASIVIVHRLYASPCITNLRHISEIPHA